MPVISGWAWLASSYLQLLIWGAAVTMLRRQGDSSATVAEKLAKLAPSKAVMTQGDTLFAVGKREAGKNWDGGRMDDITVIVAHIT